MAGRDLFDRVVLSLYDALTEDACWPAAASLIEEACGATGTELVVGEGSGKDVRIHFARFHHRGQRRKDLERAYFETYHPWDERLPRLRELPEGRVTHVTELYTEHELKMSATYNEGLRRSGSQNGLNVRMDAMDGGRFVWALGDPLDSGVWGSWQIDMVQRLVPHLRHFVQTRQALATAEALNDSLGDLLDNTRLAVVHLGRGGRIAAANKLAQALLSKGDGLFEDGGFLCSRQPADDARLQTLLADALPRFGAIGVGGSITVRRSPTLSRLTVHVSPVSPRQMHFGACRVGALVIAIEPMRNLDMDQNVVATALGLTPTESRVAIALAAGQTVRDIALLMGRQESSVRSHMKRIYNKQGISRQAELVRLVLSAVEFPPSRP